MLRQTMPFTPSEGNWRYSTPAFVRVPFHSSLILVEVHTYVPFPVFLPAQGNRVFSPYATTLTHGLSRAISMYLEIFLPSLFLKKLTKVPCEGAVAY